MADYFYDEDLFEDESQENMNPIKADASPGEAFRHNKKMPQVGPEESPHRLSRADIDMIAQQVIYSLRSNSNKHVMSHPHHKKTFNLTRNEELLLRLVGRFLSTPQDMSLMSNIKSSLDCLKEVYLDLILSHGDSHDTRNSEAIRLFSQVGKENLNFIMRLTSKEVAEDVRILSNIRNYSTHSRVYTSLEDRRYTRSVEKLSTNISCVFKPTQVNKIKYCYICTFTYLLIKIEFYYLYFDREYELDFNHPYIANRRALLTNELFHYVTYAREHKMGNCVIDQRSVKKLIKKVTSEARRKHKSPSPNNPDYVDPYGKRSNTERIRYRSPWNRECDE